MDIGYGLLSALGFGVGDFLAAITSRRIGVLRTLLAVAAILGESVPAWGWSWPLCAAISLLNVAGILLLYRSFMIGTLAIVSPLASSYVVLIALFAFLTGERLPSHAFAGAVVLLLGVILVARGPGSGTGASLRGVPEAIGAALGLSSYFFAIVHLADEMGWLWPVAISRATQLVVVVAALAWLRRPFWPVLPQGLVWPLIGVGLFDTLGMAAFNLGVAAGYTTTTAALSSLYAAVTVVLAWLVLRDRLARVQWLGVGVILTGVVLVSL